MNLKNSTIIIILLGLLIFLGLLIAFTNFMEPTSYGSKVLEQSAAYGILDDNSTLRQYDFAPPPSESSFSNSETLAGNFNLTLRIPFRISENWRKINVSTTFSVGTYGGVTFFWNVAWKLHNITNVPIKSNWSHSLQVSAETPVALEKDFASNIGWDEKNATIYQPGIWYYEGTLTVFNTTLFFSQDYQIYYHMYVRVLQEVSTPLSNRALSTNFAYATVAITRGPGKQLYFS